MRGLFLGSALLALAAPASAAVKSASATGFEVTGEATVKAAPATVYKTLLNPSAWWNPEHSYSGDSRNFRIEPRAGGCFCEKLPDGGEVLHMTVVHLSPGKLVRLRGALGPLQGLPVEGPLSWTITPAGTGSKISVSYTVGGKLDGFERWAPAVDTVINEQLTRLARLLDTGSPAPAKP